MLLLLLATVIFINIMAELNVTSTTDKSDHTDFEFHVPFMNFCGPGTNLKNRLDADGKPLPHSQPVDRIDEAALRHDKFYAEHDGVRERLKADKQMIDEINDIKSPTCRECIERFIVNIALGLKSIATRIVLAFISLYLNGAGSSSSSGGCTGCSRFATR